MLHCGPVFFKMKRQAGHGVHVFTPRALELEAAVSECQAGWERTGRPAVKIHK